MRKLIAIFCLGIILLYLSSVYIFFFLLISLNHQAMREQLKFLPSGKLEKFVLSQEQFSKSKVDEHEMRIDGRMYDLARVQVTGESIIAYGLHDVREDSLFTFIAFIMTEPIDKDGVELIFYYLTLEYVQSELLDCLRLDLEDTANTLLANEYYYLVTTELFNPPR